jgi:hypothetical protein
VAEGTRLERVYSSNAIQGSNPCLSARREAVVSLDTAVSLFTKRKDLNPGSIIKNSRRCSHRESLQI